jgi:hypothetical protein
MSLLPENLPILSNKSRAQWWNWHLNQSFSVNWRNCVREGLWINSRARDCQNRAPTCHRPQTLKFATAQLPDQLWFETWWRQHQARTEYWA